MTDYKCNVDILYTICVTLATGYQCWGGGAADYFKNKLIFKKLFLSVLISPTDVVIFMNFHSLMEVLALTKIFF